MSTNLDPDQTPRRGLSRRARQSILVVAAFILVVVMIAAAAIYAEQRSSGEYRPGEVNTPTHSAVPNPTPSVWPSDWPATPEPKDDSVVPGEGSFKDVESVARNSANDVATSFAELTISWDTVTDDGTQAGLDRAMPLVADDATFQPGGSGVGAGWVNASGHDAYTVPDVVFTPGYLPEDTSGLVFEPTGEPIVPYIAEATYKWQGRDGWVSSTSASRTVYMSLVERDGQWWVVEYGFKDPPADQLAE